MYHIPPSLLAVLSLPLILKLALSLRQAPRTERVRPRGERVVILGASSGIGRAIAILYAKRGACVCIVGRRAAELGAAKTDCDVAGTNSTLAVVGDFSNAGDMVSLSEQLLDGWGGVDTLIVAAGVSALKPLLSVAGIEREGSAFSPERPTVEGVQKAADTATAALRGNYIGPLVAAVALIPILTQTSRAPSILLVNSLASVIPAPTRSLYASTKSASLLLYQALAIEHPEIGFSFILPSTVEGGFRASAVDSGEVRESDPNGTGLKKDFVAQKCIEAVDWRQKTVFLPGFYRWGHLLYWLWPAFVEGKARKKYKFSV